MDRNSYNPLFEAILHRKDRVQPTYIALSKLLELCEFSSYQRSVIRRILEKEGVDFNIYAEHVTIDFHHGDIWFDLVSWQYFKDILLGYITEEKYLDIEKWLVKKEQEREAHNTLLLFYRGKSLIELFRIIFLSHKMNKIYPYGALLMKNCVLNELIGRSPIMMAYNLFKNNKNEVLINKELNNIKRKYVIQTLNKAA